MYNNESMSKMVKKIKYTIKEVERGKLVISGDFNAMTVTFFGNNNREESIEEGNWKMVF